jgi:hypothetical protein
VQVPRLKWFRDKNKTRFVAYPLGMLHMDRFAEVVFAGKMSVGNDIGVARWRWSVQWPGWFDINAPANDKQHAADMATKAWWDAVITPPPRNVEGEIDMIIARILVMPPPNSLMSESATYLRQMQRSLAHLYERELKADTLPRPVKNLMDVLSAELFARRLAGQAEDDDGAQQWASR